MISISQMKLKFIMAFDNKSTPDMIYDNIDMQLKFKEFNSLQDTVSFFTTKEIKNNFKDMKLDILIAYYKLYNEFSSKDMDYLTSIDKNNPETFKLLDENVAEINNNINIFQQKALQYNEDMDVLNNYEKTDYNITDVANIRQYIMKDINDENKIMDVTNIINIFNNIEPYNKIQVIVYCNSEKNVVYKVNSKYPIGFGNNLLHQTFDKNTITIFNEVTKEEGSSFKKTILNFETGITTIEISEGKKFDDTLYHIIKLLSPIIKLEEDTNLRIYSGSLEYKVASEINYNDFYAYLILNPIVSKYFIVDESKKSWACSKDNYKIIFFEPLTYVLYDFLSYELFPYGKISISYKTKNKKKFVISFKAKSEDIIQTLADTFSLILSTFKQKYDKNENYSYVNTFHSNVYSELMNRAPFLFDSIDRSKGNAYTSICTAENQPIMIKEEEINSYEKYGKQIGTIQFEDVNYYFTCVKDKFPYLTLFKPKIEVKSGNNVWPCCHKTGNKNTRENKIYQNKIGSTEAIKDYGTFSVIENGTFSDFLNLAFHYEEKSYPYLVGTSFFKVYPNSVVNSFIGALIKATGLFNITNYTSFTEKCIEIRKQMIELPYDIYRQELYDVTREQFVNDIMDMDHFIDPYLYYRGLEEIFNVNIFVFSSFRNRQNNSSLEEYYSETPSLEIPRCKDYHTRKYISRGIVCIYKNYGLKRTLRDIPSCEVIAINKDAGKIEGSVFLFSVDNNMFQNTIWNYFYKTCTPLTFEKYEDEIIPYDNLYNDWDPNNLGFGPVLGQELNIYGKASLLIYKDWNVIIPPIQPLVIPPTKTNQEIYQNYIFDVYDSGTKIRAPLKSKIECIKTFDVTQQDDDGCWIEFQGMKKGIKVLCLEENQLKHIEYSEIDTLIKQKNQVSALIQIINWLWRSEWSVDYGYPPFEQWFNLHTEIIDTPIITKIGEPRVFLNNLYLPTQNELGSYNDRIDFCTQIWPYFFRHGKIIMSDKLSNRILNMMNIQDKYTYYKNPDDFYAKIPKFIVGLITTENDFKLNQNFILNIDELKIWINYTNRNINHQVSLMNMNIINNKIYNELSESINPYLFKDKNSKIYIIQNIHIMDIKNKSYAIEIAYQWKTSKYNPGPYVKTISYQIPIKYILFGIDDDGYLVPIEDESNGTNDYLSILCYKQGIYAGLLPIF